MPPETAPLTARLIRRWPPLPREELVEVPRSRGLGADLRLFAVAYLAGFVVFLLFIA